MRRALISGTGLIGTSIALGLKRLGWETLGWDPDPDALAGAVRAGASGRPARALIEGPFERCNRGPCERSVIRSIEDIMTHSLPVR